MNTNSAESFTFWTYPWDISPYSPRIFNPEYTLCQIDKNMIRLSTGSETMSANLNDIVSCTKYHQFIAGMGNDVWFAWIEFQEGITFRKGNLGLNRVCIACIHPLKGMPSSIETSNLIQVINTLRAGETPEMPRNPYHRALIRANREDEFSEEKWDPIKPPPTYLPMPTRWGVIKPVLIIGVITAIFFLIIYVLQMLGVLY